MKRLASLTLVLAALGCPVRAQSQKEMTLALQRDVAALEESIKAMKASQDEKMAILTENLRNTLDQVTRINEKMAVVQTNMGDKLGDISRQVGAPTQKLGQKVDAMNDQFLNLSNTVAELNSRIGKVDAKLDDVKKMVQTIPPPAPAPAPAPSQNPPPPDPMGSPGDKLFETAHRDYAAGSYSPALRQFREYLTTYAGAAHAAEAQFDIAEIYARRNELENAVKAYDAVITNYPDASPVADAHYMKGVALAKLERNWAAAREFRLVIAKYPSTELARNSRDYMKAMGLPLTQTSARKRSPTR